jgi:hypothetical protein
VRGQQPYLLARVDSGGGGERGRRRKNAADSSDTDDAPGRTDAREGATSVGASNGANKSAVLEALRGGVLHVLEILAGLLGVVKPAKLLERSSVAFTSTSPAFQLWVSCRSTETIFILRQSLDCVMSRCSRFHLSGQRCTSRGRNWSGITPYLNRAPTLKSMSLSMTRVDSPLSPISSVCVKRCDKIRGVSPHSLTCNWIANRTRRSSLPTTSTMSKFRGVGPPATSGVGSPLASESGPGQFGHSTRTLPSSSSHWKTPRGCIIQWRMARSVSARRLVNCRGGPSGVSRA